MIKTLTRIAVDWGVRCFGADHMRDRRVRALRLVEEAVELAQACHVSEAQIEQLVEVVYSRPRGMAHQEAGGVMVTLAVLCDHLGIDIETAFEIEVRRCLSRDPADFAERNRQKIAAGLTGYQ